MTTKSFVILALGALITNATPIGLQVAEENTLLPRNEQGLRWFGQHPHGGRGWGTRGGRDRGNGWENGWGNGWRNGHGKASGVRGQPRPKSCMSSRD
jgi:hypothetical protein